MFCPKCVSTNISVQAVSNTFGSTKGFGCLKSCFGILILGPIGFFLGLCGMGKGRTKTKIKQIRICQHCGYQW